MSSAVEVELDTFVVGQQTRLKFERIASLLNDYFAASRHRFNQLQKLLFFRPKTWWGLVLVNQLNVDSSFRYDGTQKNVSEVGWVGKIEHKLNYGSTFIDSFTTHIQNTFCHKRWNVTCDG